MSAPRIEKKTKRKLIDRLIVCERGKRTSNEQECVEEEMMMGERIASSPQLNWYFGRNAESRKLWYRCYFAWSTCNFQLLTWNYSRMPFEKCIFVSFQFIWIWVQWYFMHINSIHVHTFAPYNTHTHTFHHANVYHPTLDHYTWFDSFTDGSRLVAFPLLRVEVLL